VRNHPLPPPRVWPVVLLSLIGFAFLMTLGLWQVQRLQWKEGLLAQLAAKAAAQPVDLATAESMAARGEDLEFTKVRFRASFKHDAWMKMISAYQGGQGWTIITPAIESDGYAVIVDRGRLPGQRLEHFDKPQGEQELTGVIRTYARGQGYFDPQNDPRGNYWYWWDIPAMLAASELPPGLKSFPYAVQLLPGGNASAEFPEPPPPRTELSNNHLGYAITWFGLAAALLATAFAYIRSVRKSPNA